MFKEMDPTDEVDEWIRRCAYDVGFTKQNKFIGLTLFVKNFVRSFEAMLAVMVEEGLVADMLEVSRRVDKGEKGGKAEGKEGEVVILTPESVPKPKGKTREKAAESQKEDSSTVQHFNFSKINIGTPIIETEAPVHTFRFQHQVLIAAQSTLESICYNFSEKHYPSILSRNKWKCPEAGELTAWTKELIKSFEANPKPVTASIYNPTRFPQVLKDLAELRHTTVHRTRVSGEKLSSLLGHAFTAAKMFKDNRGINDIALLFHGQSDCLALAQEAKKEKVELKSCTEGCLEYLERELGKLEKRANMLWEGTLVALECVSQQQQAIDEVYENVLENQLGWMCGGSRKGYAMISEEFQVQLPGKPEPANPQSNFSSPEYDDPIPIYDEPMWVANEPASPCVEDDNDGW